MQLTEMERLTGRIRVDDAGWVDLVRGAIVAAQANRWDGLTAFCELCLLRQGLATVHDHQPGATRPLGAVPKLVIEAARRQDDVERLEHVLLANTRPDADRTMRRFSGRWTVRELASMTSQPLTELAQIASQGLRDGTLQHRGERAPTRPAPTSPTTSPRSPSTPSPPASSVDFYDLLDQGRGHLRRRELDQAEQAFRQALVLRPTDRIAAQNLRRVLHLAEEAS